MIDGEPTTDVAGSLRENAVSIAASGQPLAQWMTLRLFAARAETLEAENARLREALEQYADRGNWFGLDPDSTEHLWRWVGDGDGPELAQRALANDKERGR